MKEILIECGWDYAGMCKVCSGNAEQYTHKDHPMYLIKLFKQGFYILLKNQRQVKRGTIADIKEVIATPEAYQRI